MDTSQIEEAADEARSPARRLRAFAIEVLGREKAENWLERPNAALDGATPAALLDDVKGADRVESLLGGIARGIGG